MTSAALDENQFVITDYTNSEVKLLDKKYNVTKWCAMQGGPWGVCKTGNREVAISLYSSKKVQIIIFGNTITMAKLFNVHAGCRGVCYNRGELYVTCDNGQIKVYTMSGTLLRTIESDRKGQELFRNLFLMSISSSGSRMYIADRKTGINVVDAQSNIVSQVTDPRLQFATGVSMEHGGQLIACGYNSHNVLLLDNQGNSVEEILSQSDGIMRPNSVAFVQNPRRIVVTCSMTNTIKIFKLT